MWVERMDWERRKRNIFFPPCLCVGVNGNGEGKEEDMDLGNLRQPWKEQGTGSNRPIGR